MLRSNLQISSLDLEGKEKKKASHRFVKVVLKRQTQLNPPHSQTAFTISQGTFQESSSQRESKSASVSCSTTALGSIRCPFQNVMFYRRAVSFGLTRNGAGYWMPPSTNARPHQNII